MKKKAIFWILGVLLSPVILFIVISVLLYLPPVQRWAVGVATDYASDAMDMNISIDDIRLKFPLDLKVSGVKAFQQNDSIKNLTDTVLMADNIVCSVPLRPLFDGQVNIDAFNLEGVKVNTADFIHSARVKGTLSKLTLKSHCIDLKKDTLKLDDALIRGAHLDIALSDTVPEDTTKTSTDWRIRACRLLVENSSVKVHMPGDTLVIGGAITRLAGQNGYFDLLKPIYQLQKADLTAKRINVNDFSLADITLGVEDLDCSDKKISLNLRNLQTPYSKITAKVDLDFNFMDTDSPGQIVCDLNGNIGKHDIMMFLGDMPKTFRQAWPSQPLTISAVARGNMQKMYIGRLNVNLPTLLRCRLDGWMSNLMDTRHLCAALNVDATTYHLDPIVASFLTPHSTLHIPSGITANGRLFITDLRKYDAQLTVREGGGTLSGDAHINTSTMAYRANLTARSLNLGHFVKGAGLGIMSGKIVASGHGTDIFSKSTTITANASLQQFSYDKYNLNGTSARLTLSGGHCRGVVNAHNKLIAGTIGLDALLRGKIVRATLAGDISNIDLYRLGIMESPLNVAVCAHVDVATDLKDYYFLQGLVSDLTIRDTAMVYRPDDIVLDVSTDKRNTHAVVDCGDFHLNADFQGGYKRLLNSGNRLMAVIKNQIDNRTLDDMALRKAMPIGHFILHTGLENPISRSLAYMGLTVTEANIDMTSSVVDGLNGTVAIDTLKYEKSLQLDKIRLTFNSDPQQINYTFLVENGKGNPQATFRAQADGYLYHEGLKSVTRIWDENDKLGLQIGLLASVVDGGLKLHVDSQEKTILGYKAFTVNEDNYMYLRKDMRVSAMMRMTSDDDMGLQIVTDDDNTDALQDITLSLSNFELSQLTAAIPYMPSISGKMNGDFHVIQTTEDVSISSDIDVSNLVYEGSAMGNFKTEFVYIPENENTHKLDGVIYKDDAEVAAINGTYDTRGEGNIEAKLTLKDFPLDYVNGFIPQQIVGLKGTGEGELSIRGSLQKPDVDGEIFLEDASLVSVPYGVNMRFDNDPVRIVDSKLLLENFQLYSSNNQPLLCMGSIDFSDTEHMRIDLRMKATNFMVIDAKENSRSEAYGRAYVNFFGAVNGEFSNLKVRGKVDVLSKSNIYYILRDSPITTDNRLKELVQFTDFSSNNVIETKKPTVDGLDVRFTLNVAEGSHIKCWMNTSHSNYLDLVGGGELKMTYSSGEMSLRGRYTMSEGEMKYSLPVIPLKTFKISDGSYVEFNGAIDNPTLNITAQEETKASVSTSGSSDKTVMFTCGVVITKTLKDMGLEFIIDAPEDHEISEQLQTMTIDERGKVAVTMLTTGMYLSDGNTSSFSMNSALSSFLQSEINNITGSALRTLDMSVGLESSTDEYGALHTDYSFKFAKRFWNNRLSISIGGKISNSPNVDGQNKSFFDNVELQYRLSESSNQYLTAFYKRSVYDYLEGYVGQYGGGYLWKRRLRYFRDIFSFRNGNETPIPPKTTSLPTPTVAPLDSIKK